MINNEKFTVIEHKYLAEALAYLNFKYYKFTDEGKTYYSFKKNDEIIAAIATLRNLRKKFNQ
ncbi:hypothetical protein SAMN02745248_00600 [Hathewaya proteolytica DSM 3090]|uniref:DUF5659 domain-containing protein n=1 Tax=Hathewaya proteolytica DSM 3090 TaxID=1121331 RepID=A0A1M6L2R4_9CLOT|nr:hypothetical protein [Hathewaya proteolytica]SHJ65477.1 hypothetical protein SAMN02745248_00600 [Hathewaya proteolytica DSM 3090]